LLKALETLTDVDILSQPTLTTQDNESANIVVGQELPVPTVRTGYSSLPTSGTSSTAANQIPYYGLSSYGNGISREDVGVKMKVKPHINEGDYVSMETEIEVSEATQSDVGINANDLGPTFNKSKVTNNVVVKDGSTSVVGGLIKETANHIKNQTPILGDIPVLGFFFRNKNDTRKKQDVVVLMTPHIIKEGADLDRVSDYKMDEFRNMNVDILFEKGIIKKVKKGQYMRDKYRPSVERSEKMERSSKFGRGDIERE
jgi:general secretion pathway protein D